MVFIADVDGQICVIPQNSSLMFLGKGRANFCYENENVREPNMFTFDKFNETIFRFWDGIERRSINFSWEENLDKFLINCF